jgi:F-type H+-transporting ATPase subunit epsilon
MEGVSFFKFSYKQCSFDFPIFKFSNFQINMTLEILTPEKKLYSGEVYGIQLPGITGLFEVLDQHAPLVSALGKGNLKILKDKSNTELYSIQSGFVEVLNNKVTVLVEGASAI